MKLENIELYNINEDGDLELTEVWKPVKGYEGLYEVSNLGLVRNAKTQKLLKRRIHWKHGYLMVQLSKEGKAERKSVKCLVYDAFDVREEGDRYIPIDNAILVMDEGEVSDMYYSLDDFNYHWFPSLGQELTRFDFGKIGFLWDSAVVVEAEAGRPYKTRI